MPGASCGPWLHPSLPMNQEVGLCPTDGEGGAQLLAQGHLACWQSWALNWVLGIPLGVLECVAEVLGRLQLGRGDIPRLGGAWC